MFELSPSETAANAYASSTPAWTSVSRSNPTPVTRRPANALSSRRNASGFWSITATEWPRCSRDAARVAPTRPQPMMTKCTSADAIPLTLVSDIADAAKPLLLGPPVRSDRLGRTPLPKRIALPVSASGASSSVAYAPAEILLTSSVAGLGATLVSPWVGMAVAVVMLVVVAAYRQNVRAYPSGGGDYEVATVNLGTRAGVTVAGALLVDYVLTVAVSISS